MKLTVLLQGYPGVLQRGWMGWSTVALVESEGRRVLFDTGNYNDRPVLLARLEEMGLVPADIDTVVLSHLHFDHVFNLDLFLHARVIVHRLEKEGLALHRDPALPHMLLAPLLERMQVEWQEEGAKVAPGMELLHTPGHTEGSASLLLECRQGRIALAGDALKNAREMQFHLEDPSIKRLLQDSDFVVPGHDIMLDAKTGQPAEAEQAVWMDVLSPAPCRVDLRRMVETSGDGSR